MHEQEQHENMESLIYGQVYRQLANMNQDELRGKEALAVTDGIIDRIMETNEVKNNKFARIKVRVITHQIVKGYIEELKRTHSSGT